MNILQPTASMVVNLIMADNFPSLIAWYKKIYYNMDILKQTACMAVNVIRLITLLPSLFAWYETIGYNLDILQPTACMVFNLIMADNFASLIDCMI